MANDYAMATKARALYSKHLNQQNYTNLLDMETVRDIAAYLKNETRYKMVLEGVNEAAIHRDFLEQRIRSIAMNEFLSLMRYVEKEKHHFYEFYIRELEMNQLIFVLHAIESNTEYHYGKFLNELNHLMVFDVDALMVCKTYKEVLEVIENTDYRSVLALLNSDKPDLARAEDNLQEFYNNYMLNLIKEEGDKDLLEIFNMHLELENIALVYRMKHYFELPPEEMSARLNGPFQLVSKKKLMTWIDSYSGSDIIKELEDIFSVGKSPDEHIEHYFDVIKLNHLKKKLRFSTNTDLILFAYMGLVSIEIDNIVDIIEGVRYKLTVNDIEKQLIY